MPRCADRLTRSTLGLTLGLLALAGCAFDEGDPWGRATFNVQVEMPVPGDRLDADGRIRTSTDYLLTIDTLELQVDALTLQQQGAAATAFDPANPPTGYSLCHNGHCHADDGRLVDYEDIAIEAADGQAALVGGIDQAVTVEPGGTAVSLQVDCAACTLSRGTLSALELRVSRVRLIGEVRDARQGDASRLAQPTPFDLLVDANTLDALTVSAPLEQRIGRGQPVDLSIETTLILPTQALDAVDWQAPQPRALLTGLRDRAELRVTTP